MKDWVVSISRRCPQASRSSPAEGRALGRLSSTAPTDFWWDRITSESWPWRFLCCLGTNDGASIWASPRETQFSTGLRWRNRRNAWREFTRSAWREKETGNHYGNHLAVSHSTV